MPAPASPETVARPRRVYVDVSATLAQPNWTGIQRVVRKLVAEFEGLAGPSAVEVRPVAAMSGRFHAVNDEGSARLLAGPDAGGTAAPPAGGRIRRWLEKVPPLLLAVQSRYAVRRDRKLLEPFVDFRPLAFDAGDIVLLLDDYWSGSSAITAARRARSQGARVVAMVHDLIPISNPEWMTPVVATAFPRRLAQAIGQSAGAITNSHASAAQLRAFLDRRSPDLPIVPFRLGNDFSVPAHRKGGGDTLRYLMVGTIEPRKGHDVVLDAFDSLWAEGRSATLTFVGKLGWAEPALIERCRSHPELGRRLHLIHDASDERLAGILASSAAMIVASRMEGFGLPIVEALAQDIPVIASDIAVFREIGGDSILYFPCGDGGRLADAVRRFEADPQTWQRAATAFEWIGWRQSAQQALAAVLAIAEGKATT